MQTRMFTLGTGFAALSMMGTLIAPGVAQASSNGRKNTAIGLGAAAAHQILTGKTTNGVLLGAGAAYAYKRYKDSERDENRRKRTANYYRSNSSRTRYGSANTTRVTSRSRYGAANRTGRMTRETANTYVPHGSYYFTGHVINDASELTNRVLTIDHNGVSRRVHVPKSATVVQAGQNMSMHDLKKGDMVRVLAVRTPDRWNASKVELLSSVDANDAVADRDTFGDAYTRRGGSDTRTTRTTRTTTSRYNGTGVIESIDREAGTFTVRVGSNLRTVIAGDARFHGVGSIDDLREGDRVRVSGNLDDRDVNALDVTFVE